MTKRRNSDLAAKFQVSIAFVSMAATAILRATSFEGPGSDLGRAKSNLPSDSGPTIIAPVTSQSRALSLSERVAYQYAIEEVFWRHRIWPKENAGPKPSLDEVISPAQIQQKVKDYLRNSELLSAQWQRPITGQQLQAEVERMAKNTQQADVLQELFAALGNDPALVAECLARPVLAGQLARESFARDEKLHGELRRRAENEIQALGSLEEMKRASGVYSEMVWVRSDISDSLRAPPTGITTGEWEEKVQKLARQFEGEETAGKKFSQLGGRMPNRKDAAAVQHTGANGNAPLAEVLVGLKIGVLSRLQEDDSRYYATAVLEKDNDRLKVATIAWEKEPFESWAEKTENGTGEMQSEPVADYWLPQIVTPSGGCTSDIWTATSGAPDARNYHTAVWTGSEMIVWGGFGLRSGGRYNPSTDSWVATSLSGAPVGRYLHTAVWTGSEMIVWGGEGTNYLRSGGRYNPIADSWVAIATSNAPTAREYHTAVWTGSEMIVWGGTDGNNGLSSGGRYNPSTDSWVATNGTNAPTPRAGHSAVWTGSEMIIWGGGDNTGGRYNPSTDGWVATSVTGGPAARYSHTAVWTGNEMIVWGGSDGNNNLNSGGRYNPTTDAWVSISTSGAPASRYGHTAVWIGSEMIVWGGTNGGVSAYFNTGGRYNPSSDNWVATSTSGAPASRYTHTAVWTGNEMIIWGGLASVPFSSGGKYYPSTNSWIATGANNAPDGRAGNTAIWTGSEMIVWGGSDYSTYFNSGGQYNPSTDSWVPTNTSGAPSGRASHTAIWTGNEMIVWGGTNDSAYFNSGGQYNPTTGSWVPTSTSGAPAARASHTAVWTGSELVIWGGTAGGVGFNSGGRYNPSTDSWVATSSNGAPIARSIHTAVWTGSEMIVWGGTDIVGGQFNTGGRYNPSTDSWVATGSEGAPVSRYGHTAIWTGNEMIVWGGYNNSSTVNSGGRYNPIMDSWAATSINGAPSPRGYATAIWTSSEMIVWGGHTGIFGTYLNTGGRYHLSADNWVATSITGAPAGRDGHTVVWTGNEMIVWGGYSGSSGYFNTGGRYCSQTALPSPTPTPGTPTPTPCAVCTPTPTPGPTSTPVTPTVLGDISTRLQVGIGNNVLIAGFIVSGTQPKKIIARALGPSLPLLGALANPFLDLRDSSGTSIRADDDWRTGGQEQEIMDTMIPPTNDLESAVVETLPANDAAYTAIVSGVNNTTGVGLVEIYDLDQTVDSKFANISTRGFVQTGNDVMIAGTIVLGSTPQRVLIRGLGPALPFSGALADPYLELRDSSGTLILSCDNWHTCGQESEIIATGAPPSNDAESAIVADLASGAYTAILSGVNNTTGVALVEIYALSN